MFYKNELCGPSSVVLPNYATVTYIHSADYTLGLPLSWAFETTRPWAFSYRGNRQLARFQSRLCFHTFLPRTVMLLSGTKFRRKLLPHTPQIWEDRFLETYWVPALLQTISICVWAFWVSQLFNCRKESKSNTVFVTLSFIGEVMSSVPVVKTLLFSSRTPAKPPDWNWNQISSLRPAVYALRCLSVSYLSI